MSVNLLLMNKATNRFIHHFQQQHPEVKAWIPIICPAQVDYLIKLQFKTKRLKQNFYGLIITISSRRKVRQKNMKWWQELISNSRNYCFHTLFIVQESCIVTWFPGILYYNLDFLWLDKTYRIRGLRQWSNFYQESYFRNENKSFPVWYQELKKRQHHQVLKWGETEFNNILP